MESHVWKTNIYSVQIVKVVMDNSVCNEVVGVSTLHFKL